MTDRPRRREAGSAVEAPLAKCGRSARRDASNGVEVAIGDAAVTGLAVDTAVIDVSAATDVDATAATGWCLYLIECRNGSYYAGITNRLDARYAAHVAGRGARYTRANPPLQLLGSRPFPDRAAAARAEWQIRQLPRERKRAFLDLREP